MKGHEIHETERRNRQTASLSWSISSSQPNLLSLLYKRNDCKRERIVFVFEMKSFSLIGKLYVFIVLRRVSSIPSPASSTPSSISLIYSPSHFVLFHSFQSKKEIEELSLIMEWSQSIFFTSFSRYRPLFLIPWNDSSHLEVISPTLVSYSIYSLSHLTAIQNYHILDNPVFILLSPNIPIIIYILLPLTEVLSFHPYFFSSQP